MSEITLVMFVLLFITVIFVIYFLQIGARIENLTKKYNDLLEDSYRDNLRYASQFDHLYTAIRELGKSFEDVNKHE